MAKMMAKTRFFEIEYREKLRPPEIPVIFKEVSKSENVYNNFKLLLFVIDLAKL